MTLKTKRVITVTSLILIISFVLLLSVAYIQYRDFKKAFVVKLSTQATSFIGQEVVVGDLSLALPEKLISMTLLFIIRRVSPQGSSSR